MNSKMARPLMWSAYSPTGRVSTGPQTVASSGRCGEASACGERLMHPVEANELFVRLAPGEREALRAQGFGFYDWGADAARFVVAVLVHEIFIAMLFI